jgi:DNA-binding SARP family transcriptional activator
MDLYARSGQRSAALAQYALCRQVLADELGVAPADETQALYRAILANQREARVPDDAPALSPFPQTWAMRTSVLRCQSGHPWWEESRS